MTHTKVEMCCNVSRQLCCIFIGLLAITVGSTDLGYRAHLLDTFGWNLWLLLSVLAWVPIILTAVLLIKILSLLVTWITVVLIFGVVQIFIKIVLFTPPKNIHPQDTYYIVSGGLIILLILFVFSSAYYPYAYKREIEEEEFE
ncbi:uncharacterized protein LOC26526101 isoform X2 [Drosophila erecta]|uniref:uncharacterized protein LOC26526101 isoform X2 n=1 Tax=Drosophila erecta TaxID=7220 RepID=UPI000F06418D|nr:uncharacterized protein LOC26526101 isoform X2 [Drosophila erecta]